MYSALTYDFMKSYLTPFGTSRSILRIKLDPRIGRGVPNDLTRVSDKKIRNGYIILETRVAM